jgi:glycosyltransferase involved in cell wall biosynthesis
MHEVIFMRPVGRGSPAIYAGELAKNLKNYPNIEIRDINTPVSSFSELLSWSKYVLQNKNKIFHFPFQHYAKFSLLGSKSIISVHDMWWMHEIYGNDKFEIKDRILNKLDLEGIKKATWIITPSNFSMNQVVDCLHIDQEKITVIYNGLNHHLFKPVDDPSPFSFDYILFVGSEQPRKNFKTLLKSFKLIKEQDEFKNLKLIKIGGAERQIFREQSLKEIKKLNLMKDVIFIGYVQEKDLAIYYSNAKCYVSPSLCEGFGFPTVEAMACGCPVITANTSAFPEVVGDAGFLRDPFDLHGFADAISEVILNEQFRHDLIKKGIIRAKKFSWELCAEQVKTVYENI